MTIMDVEGVGSLYVSHWRQPQEANLHAGQLWAGRSIFWIKGDAGGGEHGRAAGQADTESDRSRSARPRSSGTRRRRRETVDKDEENLTETVAGGPRGCEGRAGGDRGGSGHHGRSGEWRPGGELTETFSEDEEGMDDGEEVSECLLTHPAGFGVLDTGCGRGIVGEVTLRKHEIALNKTGLRITELKMKPQRFRYGNGSTDEAIRRVQIPCYLRGKLMGMKVYVVPGKVPLLISKKFLKGLGAKMDLEKNTLVLNGLEVEMHEPPDGSYQLNLMDGIPTQDVMAVTDKGPGDDSSDEDEGQWCVMSRNQRKKLQANLVEVMAASNEPMSVAEVFVPGRFADECARAGVVSKGIYDLSNGWDWKVPLARREAQQSIQPNLVALSPPCGALSVLQNLTLAPGDATLHDFQLRWKKPRA